MTSHEISCSWDFTEALNLLHAYGQPRSLDLAAYVVDNTLSPVSSGSSNLDDNSERRPTLGNFDRVFRKLKIPMKLEKVDTHSGSLDHHSSVLDDKTAPTTTPLDCDSQHLDDFVSTKEVRWTDQVESGAKNIRKRIGVPKGPDVREASKSSSSTDLVAHNQNKLDKRFSQGFRTPKSQRYALAQSLNSNEEAVGETSLFESEVDESNTNLWSRKIPYDISDEEEQDKRSLAPVSILNAAKQLLPAWVTPLKSEQKLWQPPNRIDSGTIRPLLYLTRQEKEARIVRRLGSTFGKSFIQHLDLPRLQLKYNGNTASDGIHVFVDSSNIAIGFYNALKLARGIPVQAHTKQVPLSFHSLALVMERGRSVAKRVLVGSSDRSGLLPEYMKEAACCGYEINSLNRVEKFKETRSSGKKSRNGNGYGTSGQSSGSETSMVSAKKVTEQGVDEILHMKMLESLVDSKQPSTMVLATGDGAEAEYSSGFFTNVERALSKGWKVEVVAWGHSMSFAYRSRTFLKKWKGQFTAIDLDEFSEDLLGVYVDPGHGSHAKHWGPAAIVDDDFASDFEDINS